jgi:hypothetical protein
MNHEKNELLEELNDPDEGLSLRPEIVALLQEKSAPLEERVPVEVLAAQYGLKW